LASFDPGDSPATTPVVFFETLSEIGECERFEEVVRDAELDGVLHGLRLVSGTDDDDVAEETLHPHLIEQVKPEDVG